MYDNKKIGNVLKIIYGIISVHFATIKVSGLHTCQRKASGISSLGKGYVTVVVTVVTM